MVNLEGFGGFGKPSEINFTLTCALTEELESGGTYSWTAPLTWTASRLTEQYLTITDISDTSSQEVIVEYVSPSRDTFISKPFVVHFTGDSHDYSHKEFVNLQEQTYQPLIYPNPAGNEISIYMEQPIKDAWITIYDSYGRTVYDNYFSELSYENLDVASLHNGMYILQIRTPDHHYSSKIHILR